MEKSSQRFVGKKDLILTPIIEIALVLISIVSAYFILDFFGDFRWLEFLVILYFLIMAFTIILLKIIRVCYPFKEGIFTSQEHPAIVYRWNLYGFLCITNLSLIYQNNLLPIPFRKLFLQLLGAKIGPGVFAISGLVTDPHMVTIEENVILGDECYVSPHGIVTLSSGDALIVKRIHLKKNCIIGARAVLLPGVVVGIGSTVAPNTVVPMNTVISDGEFYPKSKVIS
ncbi:MAG: hypothetical protein JNM24_05660 [Bdellovibrionaceae bacterium]|nr:hypothetical protein [Pseudobdellovibrionaceae bacterium]